MKHIRLRSVMIAAAAVLMGTLLLHTSQQVQVAEDRVASLKSAIAHENETIRVLEAEWQFLNTPARLETLAAGYLDLVPPKPAHIQTDRVGLPGVVMPNVPEPQNISYEALGENNLSGDLSSAVDLVPVVPVRKPKVSRRSFGDLLNSLQSGGSP